jgi:hypothetical protein
MLTGLDSRILPKTTYQDLILPIVHKTCLGRLHWIHKTGDLVRCIELENFSIPYGYRFIVDRKVKAIRLEKIDTEKVLATWVINEARFWQIIDKVPRKRTLNSFLASIQNFTHNL